MWFAFSSPRSADDREADTRGDVRSDTPEPETEKPVSDTKECAIVEIR